MTCYTRGVEPCASDVEAVLASLGALPAPSPRPALVLLSGLPGSGKSTVADALCRRVPAALLQSDRIRKLLLPAPDYSAEESARVFAAIQAAAVRLLAAGIPVIVDATMLAEREREPFARLAGATGARFLLVRVTAPVAVIRRRLAARQRGQRSAFDLSDAGIEVYELMRAREEPIRGPHIVINTGAPFESDVDALASVMRGADVDADTDTRRVVPSARARGMAEEP